MARQNAAIYYVEEAFDTGRDRLLGRRAAGEGFLNAFADHADIDHLVAYCRSPETFENFYKFVERPRWNRENVSWISLTNLHSLGKLGCMFFGSPGIDVLAWQRRFWNQRGYSLCGLTHTTASHAVMDTVFSLHTAPLQTWDAIICTSTVVKKTFEQVLAEWADYLSDRIQAKTKLEVQLPIIPLGVNCEQFTRTPEMEAYSKSFREQHGIGADDIVVLFMGRLAYHAKAHPLPMYQAMERAAQTTGKKVHCVQVGWFANEHIEQNFRRGAERHCPSVNAIFLDGRDREIRRKIWFVADIFCSLSDNIQETFGLAPIEAMAASLPVVVTDWNGYRDTARHGLDGFCIPTAMASPGLGRDIALRHSVALENYDVYIGHASQFTSVDVNACTAAFEKLFTDPELRRTMGATGRKRALDTFDWSKVVSAYQDLWAELSARRAVDQELVPVKPGRAPCPSRDDPFSVFRSYPSQIITGNTRFQILNGADTERLRAFRRDPLTNMSRPLLSSEADCETVLAHLRNETIASANDLVSLLPSQAQQLHMKRTLGWLAKVGLIAVLPD